MDLNSLNPLQSTWIEMKPNKPSSCALGFAQNLNRLDASSQLLLKRLQARTAPSSAGAHLPRHSVCPAPLPWPPPPAASSSAAQFPGARVPAPFHTARLQTEEQSAPGACSRPAAQVWPWWSARWLSGHVETCGGEQGVLPLISCSAPSLLLFLSLGFVSGLCSNFVCASSPWSSSTSHGARPQARSCARAQPKFPVCAPWCPYVAACACSPAISSSLKARAKLSYWPRAAPFFSCSRARETAVAAAHLPESVHARLWPQFGARRPLLM
jgi:hypothetical protein